MLPNEIEIEYETFGSPDRRAFLLVAGFTSQMTAWEPGFCELLVDGGYHVIRYDNRDCGLSTIIEGHKPNPHQVLSAQLAGEPIPDVPYTLADMAADGMGLLDHLSVEAAHVMGVSMGGMIVQTMAIEHPRRVLSLISIMSSTGDMRIGKPTDEALQVLLRTPPTEREAFISASRDTIVWASKRYGDVDRIAARSAAAFDRSFQPTGNVRQLAAIYASGDRAARLAEVTAPTLVIHGLDDTLIDVSGGMATAECIPHSNLLLVGDMGHDLPEPLWPLLTNAAIGLATTADRASAAR